MKGRSVRSVGRRVPNIGERPSTPLPPCLAHKNMRGAFNAPRERYATDLGFGFVFAFGGLLRFPANSAATDFSTFSTSTR